MATNTAAASQANTASASARDTDLLMTLLRPLASLKLTVALLAMAIFIVLVGTLAQVDMDMWAVMARYFKAWVTLIPLRVFFPRTWFPNLQVPNVPIPFFGGASIGLAMCVNLLAAHAIRFQSHAKGTKLAAGVLVTVAGILVTWLVIASGHSAEGLQAAPILAWDTMWDLTRFGLAAGTTASILFFVWLFTKQRTTSERVLAAAGAGLLALATAVVFLFGEDAYLGDSGMRILWQLAKATFAGLVLLAGCQMLFDKRAGVVLLHGGIGLMMFGQFYVSQYDREEQITMSEGETVAYAQDIRAVELAIVNRNDPKHPNEDVVVAIPLKEEGVETQFLGRKEPIREESLPFDIEIVKFWANADMQRADVAKTGEKSPAAAGKGKDFIVIEDRPGSGADMSSKVDLATALVKFTERKSGTVHGPYLLSQLAFAMRDGNEFNFEEPLTIDGVTYDIAVRFRRNYKDYALRLIDVRKDDYPGTTTPKNYSSDIQLVANKTGVDRTVKIWMNNPLRYAGETFYQSGYNKDMRGVEHTTLQVVRNSGWMIPYVACMIVTVGMGAHFFNTMLRFLRRQAKPNNGPVVMATLANPAKNNITSYLVAAGVVLLEVIVFASFMRVPKTPADQMDLRAFANLPVLADGRIKPFDSLARESLRAVSGREEFRDASGKRQPAVRWLLDVISDADDAHAHNVFRIDNLEVLAVFDLEKRNNWLYSVEDLKSKINEFEQLVKPLRAKKNDQMTVVERKLVELDTRLRTFTKLRAAFRPPQLPELPSEQDFAADRQKAIQMIEAFRSELSRFSESLDQGHVPLAVPYRNQDRKKDQDEYQWQPYSRAYVLAMVDAQMLGRTPDKALLGLNSILVPYAKGEVENFNKAVVDYRGLLNQIQPKELVTKDWLLARLVQRIFNSFYGMEAYFNHVAPFYYAAGFYVLAFVLVAFGWVAFRESFHRSAYWLLVMTFVIHTVALAARIYISGRPPVTNLYSSAIFIGWGAVAFGLCLELLFKLGIGSAVAANLGFGTLVISHNLAGDGDTLAVLQAVLDTQFWLATHVIIITLGYMATLFAGALGIAYVLLGLATTSLREKESRKSLDAAIYGIICFATFLSFVGTVLGGLWADDSWGRFWGWDPKENGALIIVLWNALALHARWDKLVGERGFAVLSVVGNIVTAWSWFGVNELSVGLHTYGFSEGRLMWLGLFILSQLLIVGIGLVPLRNWRSYRETPTATVTFRADASAHG